MVSKRLHKFKNEIAHEYGSENAYAIFEKVLAYSATLLEGVDTIKDTYKKF